MAPDVWGEVWVERSMEVRVPSPEILCVCAQHKRARWVDKWAALMAMGVVLKLNG